MAREGTIDVEFDDRVELSRLLKDLKSVSALVFLRHEVQVLVMVYDLFSCLILLGPATSGHMRLGLINYCRPMVAMVNQLYR